MPYCSRCGVEVDDSVMKCPLCDAPIQHFPDSEGTSPVTPYPTGSSASPRKAAPDKHAIYLTWMILSVILFTAFFVILAIGAQSEELDDWAAYPLASLVAVWFCCTLLLFFLKKPVILSAGVFLSIVSLLFAFDILNGRLEWFFPVAIPLLLFLYAVTFAVILVSVRVKYKGLNIGGFILIGSGLFCVGTDMLLSLFLTGEIAPGWSLVAVSSFIPLAVFLLCLHYLLKKKVRFKRFFHF